MSKESLDAVDGTPGPTRRYAIAPVGDDLDRSRHTRKQPALEVTIDLNDQQSAPVIDDGLHFKVAIEISHPLENSRTVYSCQQLPRCRAPVVIEGGIGNMI